MNLADISNSSILKVNIKNENYLEANSRIIFDYYDIFSELNSYFHHDQHIFVPIITDTNNKIFKLLVGNDGWVYLSKEDILSGTNNGDCPSVGIGCNTLQFYGNNKIYS